MCKRSVHCLLVILSGVLLLCGASYSAEFSADMTESQGSYSKSGKLFVKGSQYGMELEDSGEKVRVFVDTEANKTVVLNLSKQEFRELASDDMNSLMNDPFQGYQYMIKRGFGVEKPAGTETVDGFECHKYVMVTEDSTELMSRWVSSKLNFPIKIVAHGNPSRIMALTNIVEGAVDDAKFVIPEGYTAWVDPETLPIEPPEWAKGIESAPIMTPPFEITMKAGEIIRVLPEDNKTLSVKCRSIDTTEAVTYIRPFKDGRPIYRSERYGNASMNGVICARRHETPIEADEFVFYVQSGEITANAKWQEMIEKTVSVGDDIRLSLSGWDNVEMRLINLADGESVAVFSYNREGVPLGENEMDEVKWRMITLKEPNEVHNRAVNAKGDEIVVGVESGKMHIKLGQFDVFEF